MDLISKLAKILSTEEKRKLKFLAVFLTFSGIFDMLGIASIMPFLALVGSSEKLETYYIFKYLADVFSITEKSDLLIIVGLITFFVFSTALIIKCTTLYLQIKFTWSLEYSISRRLLSSYLHRSFDKLSAINSTDISKDILSEVRVIISGVISPILIIMSQGVGALLIICMLFYVNYLVTGAMVLVFLLMYVCIFKLSSNHLEVLGRQRLLANEKRFKVMSEAFGSLREVKIGAQENSFLNKFSVPAKIFADNQATSQLIGNLPRFAFEAFGFGFLLLILIFALSRGSDISTLLPLVGLFALSGYRLLPAAQQIYNSFSQITFHSPALVNIGDSLHQHSVVQLRSGNQELLKDSIELNKVSFKHENSKLKAINGATLKIKAGTKNALVGPTGGGKTTLADLISGLLFPTSGAVKFDGLGTDDPQFGDYQSSISYVPQDSYLFDDTIRANMLFAVESQIPTDDLFERAAAAACVSDFVLKLPNEFETLVGERGSNLSGGQRQRVAISRALCRNPKILILDEATSALDSVTERDVLDGISKNFGEVTIVMIAHRLQSIKNCDVIHYVEQGRVVASGSYQTLLSQCKKFRELVTYYERD